MKLFPRFKSGDAENEYADFRRGSNSTILSLEVTIWSGVVIFIIFWLMNPTARGAFYRLNNIASAMYISLARRIFFYIPSRLRHYDIIATIWGIHHVLYQSLSAYRAERLIAYFGFSSKEELEVPMDEDEGYQLLWCCILLLAFALYTGTSLRWLFFLLCSAPALWIVEVVMLGTSLTVNYAAKHFFVYLFLCLLTFMGARKTDVDSRKRFLDNRKLQTWYVGLKKLLATNFDVHDTVDLTFMLRVTSGFRPLLGFAIDREKHLYEFAAGPAEQKRFQDFLQCQRDQIQAAPSIFHGPYRITVSLDIEDHAADIEIETIWLPGVSDLDDINSEHMECFGALWIGMRHSRDLVESSVEELVHTIVDTDEDDIDCLPDIEGANNLQRRMTPDLDKHVQEDASVKSGPTGDGSISGRSVPATATTTATSAIFAGIERLRKTTNEENQGNELRKAMESVVALGRREQWSVNKEEIEILPEVLGKGGFGVVVRGRFYGAEVALKLMRSSPDNCLTAFLPSLATELRILRRLHHPNIVLFHGAIFDPSRQEVGLVLEYIKGVPLAKLTRRGEFETVDRHSVLCQVCCGLRYLHSRTPAVVHGDLKTSNVLVEGSPTNLHVKLVDFGLARMMKGTARALGGTVAYMAPEVIHDPRPTTCADVFSFGRLTFAVVAAKEPLADHSNDQIVRALRRGQILPLSWPTHVSARCQTMCDRCLRVNPAQRPHMIAVHDEIEKWSTPNGAAMPWQRGVDALRKYIAEEEEDAIERRRRAAQQEDQGQIPNVPDHLIADEADTLEQSSEQEQRIQISNPPDRIGTMLSLPPAELLQGSSTLSESVVRVDITGYHSCLF